MEEKEVRLNISPENINSLNLPDTHWGEEGNCYRADEGDYSFLSPRLIQKTKKILKTLSDEEIEALHSRMDFFQNVSRDKVVNAANAILKIVCNECPIQEQCLEAGFDDGKILPGIWGGMDEKERRKLQKQRQAEEKHKQELRSA